MILLRTKLLGNRIIMFVIMLQIIFCQMLLTTGLPQIDNNQNKLCTLDNEQSNDLKPLSINATIKEAYHNCKDNLENFNKIINLIDKQSTQDVKDLAYNVLYQEVLNHYKLENLETTQMNLCFFETILGKMDEAIGHFKGLNPNSALQVLEKINDFQGGIYFPQLLRFIVLKPEISNVGHNIIIISLILGKNSGKISGTSMDEAGIRLIEIGARLHSTKLEPLYFDKLQEVWGDIIVSYCNSVQNDSFTFTELKDVASHKREMEGNYEKVEKYFQDILIPSVRRVLNKDGVQNKFDMILKCVPNSIPFFESGAVLYSTIFDEMVKQNLSNTNNFKTKLAYYIKNYMELPNYSRIDNKYKEIFENLKKETTNT